MTFDFHESGYLGMFPYSAYSAGYGGMFLVEDTPVIPTPIAPITFVGGMSGNAISNGKKIKLQLEEEEGEEASLLLLLMGAGYGI